MEGDLAEDGAAGQSWMVRLERTRCWIVPLGGKDKRTHPSTVVMLREVGAVDAASEWCRCAVTLTSPSSVWMISARETLYVPVMLLYVDQSDTTSPETDCHENRRSFNKFERCQVRSSHTSDSIRAMTVERLSFLKCTEGGVERR